MICNAAAANAAGAAAVGGGAAPAAVAAFQCVDSPYSRHAVGWGYALADGSPALLVVFSHNGMISRHAMRLQVTQRIATDQWREDARVAPSMYNPAVVTGGATVTGAVGRCRCHKAWSMIVLLWWHAFVRVSRPMYKSAMVPGA